MIGRLWPYAAESLRLTSRITVWDGEVRSGKTTTSLVAWVRHMRTYPGPAAIIAQSEASARQNLEPPLRAMFGGLLEWKQREVTLDGHKIWVIGAGTVHGAARLAGSTLRSLYVDEAATLDEASWDMAMLRLSMADARAFVTTNPDSPQHWLWAKWLRDAAVVVTVDGVGGTGTGDVARVRMTMRDNPYIDPVYRASVRSHYSGVYAARYLRGEWVAATGRVYPHFDPAVMVTERPNVLSLLDRDRPMRVAGVDYGTIDPFGLAGCEIGRGVVHVGHEWWWDSAEEGRVLTDWDYTQRVLVHVTTHPLDLVYVDPSAASWIAQARYDGLPVRSADNAVIDGIRDVASLLASGRMTIHPRCSRVIAALGDYQWAGVDKDGGDKPLHDASSHMADALRYVLHSTRGMWRESVGLKAIA